MVKVFISYRRDDERAVTARIRDRLANAFGSSNVFMDVDDLLPGQRFDQEIQKALSQTDCFIAIIGARWIGLLRQREASGEVDLVRKEIADALKHGIIVIPVLIDGARLPRPEDLPEDICDLVLHQKHDVSHERFGRDIDGLIHSISKIFKTKNSSLSKDIKGPILGKGLRRILTVFSVSCAIGLFVWSTSEDSWAIKDYHVCARHAYTTYGSSDSPGMTRQNLEEYMRKYQELMSECGRALDQNSGRAFREKLENALFVTVAPIPLLWLVIYVLAWTTRWIAHGFE